MDRRSGPLAQKTPTLLYRATRAGTGAQISTLALSGLVAT
jgi:hypothetical protein